MNSDAIIIRSRRWGYILYGGLAAAAGGWLVKVAITNSGGFMVLDNGVAWFIAGLVALLFAGVAVAVDYYIYPPEIRISVDGLLLVTPGRRRFWQWSQIDQYRMMDSRAPYVEFRWHPLGGSGSEKARWQSLNFDVPLLGHQIQNMLIAAQTAAKAKADAAEFQSAIEAAKNDYLQLSPRLTVVLAIMLLVPPLIMLVFAFAIHR